LNGAPGPAGATGAQGSQGPAGSPGTKWLSGSGLPPTAAGLVNDFYLNTDNGDYYIKTGAIVWTLLGNITGPQGATGLQGATGPQGAQGATGATGPQGATGPTGPQGISGTNGSDGATWHSGTGVPSNSLGAAGDYYLNNLNGDYYLKTTAFAWTLVSSLKGPKGDKGDANITGVTNYLIRFNSPTTGVNSKVYDNGVNVGIGTASPQAQLDVSGYTRLGVEAPNVAMKKLTGTTGSAEGDSVTITHGVTSVKILSVNIHVEHELGNLVPTEFTQDAGYEFSYRIGFSTITVYNKAGNSAGILSKPVKVLITYEQ
jgi:hypothetical protein